MASMSTARMATLPNDKLEREFHEETVITNGSRVRRMRVDVPILR